MEVDSMELKEYRKELEREKERPKKEAVNDFLELMVKFKIDLYEIRTIVIERTQKIKHIIQYANNPFRVPYDYSDLTIKINGRKLITNGCYEQRNALAILLRNKKEFIETIGVKINYNHEGKFISRYEKWVIDCTDIK